MNQSPNVAAHWWKFLATGGAALTAIIVVTTLTGELGDSAWLLAMVLLLGAIVTIATGLVLGIVHLAHVRPHRSSS